MFNSHTVSKMIETCSYPILILILGTLLQFLLSYVKGVASFNLSPKINFIIIQIGIVLKNTPTLNSLTKASLQIEVRECLLSFGAESFVFQFAIQKFKDQDI